MNRRLPRALTTLALVLTALILALGGVGRADSAHAAPPLGTIIILGSSVYDGRNSREAQAALALGYDVEIASNASWKAKTTAQFAAYSAIILGDSNCGSPASAYVGAAEANAATWAAATTGNVVVIGSDPNYHADSVPGAQRLIEQGIAFAVGAAGKTGAYITLSCYSDNNAPKNVPVLAGFGSFKVLGADDSAIDDDAAHIIPASVPALAGFTDEELSNWANSIHEVFTAWPAPFQPVAIGRGEVGPYIFTAGDGSTGIPYILARGPAAATETTAVSGTYRAVNPTSLTLTATVKTKAGQPVADGGVVTFTLNNETFQAMTVNGVATVTLPGYRLASYGDGTVVKASYAAAADYTPSQGTGRLTIVRR